MLVSFWKHLVSMCMMLSNFLFLNNLQISVSIAKKWEKECVFIFSCSTTVREKGMGRINFDILKLSFKLILFLKILRRNFVKYKIKHQDENRTCNHQSHMLYLLCGCERQLSGSQKILVMHMLSSSNLWKLRCIRNFSDDIQKMSIINRSQLLTLLQEGNGFLNICLKILATHCFLSFIHISM